MSATAKKAKSETPTGKTHSPSTSEAIRSESAKTSRRRPHEVNVVADCQGGFAKIYLAQPQERISTIKQGVPAAHVGALAKQMDISKELLMDTLRLPRATINRKARSAEPLSQDESERILGVQYLISQVETMVQESGDPAGFDAAKWVSGWLNSPLPALNNATPASFMDTIEGQKMVSNLLSMTQSGAYA